MKPPPYPPPDYILKNVKPIPLEGYLKSFINELIRKVEKKEFKNKILGDLYKLSPPLPSELPYPKKLLNL